MEPSGASYRDEAVARKLDNGVTVTVERLPYLHSASAGIWIKTGSANERADQCGISHFLEHLFFKGTATRTARQIIEPIESRGGHLNAFTSREYTCVYVRTLAEHLRTGIEILADVIKHSTFRDLEKERNVVLEEIASIEDVPEDYVHELLTEHIWPDHPLGRWVSGYDATVSAMSIEDIQQYYRSWYRPRNYYFSVAGNVEEQAILEQIFTEFGTLSPSRSLKRCDAPRFQAGINAVERDIGQTHFCIAFPGPTVDGPARYVYDVLSSVLGGGSSSRLFERIREDEGLAYAIYTFHSSYYAAGLFGVYAAVAPENLGKTLELVFEEIRNLRDKPISKEELEHNREHLKGSMLMALESTFNRMSRMAKSMMYYKRLLSIGEIIAALDAITVADVRTLAAEIFRPESCAMLTLGPATQGMPTELPL